MYVFSRALVWISGYRYQCTHIDNACRLCRCYSVVYVFIYAFGVGALVLRVTNTHYRNNTPTAARSLAVRGGHQPQQYVSIWHFPQNAKKKRTLAKKMKAL